MATPLDPKQLARRAREQQAREAAEEKAQHDSRVVEAVSERVQNEPDRSRTLCFIAEMGQVRVGFYNDRSRIAPNSSEPGDRGRLRPARYRLSRNPKPARQRDPRSENVGEACDQRIKGRLMCRRPGARGRHRLGTQWRPPTNARGHKRHAEWIPVDVGSHRKSVGDDGAPGMPPARATGSRPGRCELRRRVGCVGSGLAQGGW